MSASLEGDCHAVVFDVNVYLDVAELVGAPFTWQEFDRLAIEHSNAPIPHADPRIDSLRAIAVSTSGRFVSRQPLEVWTSDHVDRLVELKAAQPSDGATPELRGLGWSSFDAGELLATLVDDLVYDMSAGGTVGAVERADGTPPLSHEDGCVYTTALLAATDVSGTFYHRYIVTRDRAFRESEPDLSSEVEIYHPHEWVDMVRRVRRKVGALALSRGISP